MAQKIFESPDGGKTLYARNFGETDRKLIYESPEVKSTRERILEDKLWDEIRRKAKTHPGLQAEMERVIIFYNLIKDNE